MLNALLRDSPAPPETETSNYAAGPDEHGLSNTSPEEFQPDPEAGLEVAGPAQATPDVPGVTPAPAEPEPPSPPAVAEQSKTARSKMKTWLQSCVATK